MYLCNINDYIGDFVSLMFSMDLKKIWRRAKKY